MVIMSDEGRRIFIEGAPEFVLKFTDAGMIRPQNSVYNDLVDQSSRLDIDDFISE